MCRLLSWALNVEQWPHVYLSKSPRSSGKVLELWTDFKDTMKSSAETSGLVSVQAMTSIGNYKNIIYLQHLRQVPVVPT